MKITNKNSFFKQNGQIAVIVLLIMVVILTIGLSLATRSSEQAQITIQQEESTKIFNAAETGVEQALSGLYDYEQASDRGENPTLNTNLAEFTTDDAGVQYQISQQQTLDTLIGEGSSAEIPLNGESFINIAWSKTSCDEAAALLISIYGDDGSGNSVVRHYPIDPCDSSTSSSRYSDHFFLEANDIPSTDPYTYSHQLSGLTANDRSVRIKALYADADIAVSGVSTTLQYNIISAAQNLEAGEETKAIDVSRTLQAAPAFMDFALVSGTTIIK